MCTLLGLDIFLLIQFFLSRMPASLMQAPHLSYSLTYFLHLEQRLAHSRCLITVGLRSELNPLQTINQDQPENN